jgi:hypothetical protein
MWSLIFANFLTRGRWRSLGINVHMSDFIPLHKAGFRYLSCGFFCLRSSSVSIMRWFNFFARCALFVPLLADTVQADLTPRQSVDIPDCMVGFSESWSQF